MKKFAIAIVFMSLVLVQVGYCKMYVWTDANGVKNYSNTPVTIEENVSVDHEVVSEIVPVKAYRSTTTKIQRKIKVRIGVKPNPEHEKRKNALALKKKMRLAAEKGDLKKYYVALYGKEAGRFDEHQKIDSINDEKTIFRITGSYTPYFVKASYSNLTKRWEKGDRLYINKIDGIARNIYFIFLLLPVS